MADLKTAANKILLSRTSAAEILDCSPSTLKRLQAAGRLRPVRLGSNKVFYPREQIEALAQSGTAAPSDDAAR